MKRTLTYSLTLLLALFLLSPVTLFAQVADNAAIDSRGQACQRARLRKPSVSSQSLGELSHAVWSAPLRVDR